MSAVDPLTRVFSSQAVSDLADPRSFARGVAYMRDGRVSASSGTGHRREVRRLEVTVYGTMPYVVRLWVNGEEEPRWSCTCPAAEDGSFCKHCVAVALTLDAEDADRVDGPGEQRGPMAALRPAGERPRLVDSLRGRLGSGSDHDLVESVQRLSPDRLSSILIEHASSDWRLRERLVAELAAVRGEGPDVGAWRGRIDAAFAPYTEFVSYREAGGWAEGVFPVIDTLDDLTDAGQSHAVVLLAEHAHRRAEEAINYVDDSDGRLSVISDRLFEVHIRACRKSRPEPVELAGRLVDLELRSDLEGFRRAAAAYADVLGDAGLAAYREHLEARREPTDPDADTPDGWMSDYTIRSALVGWALGTGDPDNLIAVYRGADWIGPDAVLEIARALEVAGRVEEAIGWAERGLSESSDRVWQTRQLRGFLAERLRERGESKAAVGLFWDAFRSDPSLESYRCLLSEAEEKPGSTGGWSERCVAELRARVAGEVAGGEPAGRRAGTSNARALVAILLFEGRTDEAWEAALAVGCSHEQWMALAWERENTRPLDAIAVYEPEVLALIEQKRTASYRQAVDLMERIRRLAESSGEPERFSALLDRARTEHRAKRNLKKLLDERGW